MDPLLRASDAGRAVFVTDSGATQARAYWSAYAVSKAALETLGRLYAAETERTSLRVNLFDPGPMRTALRAHAFPGEDPALVPAPDAAARRMVDLLLPSCAVHGQRIEAQQRGAAA